VIDLFCGINETAWNHHPVNPGPLVCISPVYGASAKTKRKNRVTIPAHCQARVDVGAFCDGPGGRLSFPQALDRQLAHADEFGYSGQILDLASYDLLIDEKWEGGQRYKRRWSENDAWAAVRETVDAAAWLAANYSGRRVLSAQGVTASQYLECAIRILEYFNPDTDTFGLGGWCIAGKLPLQIRPSFNAVMLSVLPFVAKAGVKAVHIWGVTDVTFLGPLLWVCDQYGLKLSTDSSGPSVRPANGTWGFRGWYNTAYKAPPVEVRGIHRAIHVQLMRSRLNSLRQSEFYHHPDLPDGSTWSPLC
jgi:hypothetical protein